MNTLRSKLTVFLCLLFLTLFSQNAPVTEVSQVYNPVVGGSVTVPVTVSNFEDIGSISLIMDYDPAVLTFQSALPGAAFNGLVVNGTTNPGRIIISWYASYGVTLADGAHLLDITFMNKGGTTVFSWSSSDGGSCEYAKYNNGAYSVLNDSPFNAYYVNGAISSPSAPLTWVPIITNALPGIVDVPVMVNGFSNIGAISLTLEYDPAILVYQDIYISNPELSSKGTWLIGSQDAPGGKKFIRLSWTKNAGTTPLCPVNLPYNSIEVTLKFNYSGGTTDLIWQDDGVSCEYADGSFNALNDTPLAVYYKNGQVTGKHNAPRTVAPCITGIAGQTIVVPVRVYDFSNIGAISLTLNYNPAVLTWQSITTPDIPASWAVNANGIAGRLVLGAMGGAGFSLPDGSILVNVTFLYHGGSCRLTWNDDDPISCEYAEAVTYTPLPDQPHHDFYSDGCVGPAPVIHVKCFLEGPYRKNPGCMSTQLNVKGLIPHHQPYNTPPWNYTGNEHVTSTIPASVTDWVLVQLRTRQEASSAIAMHAGFLTKDGEITELDGITLLSFQGIMPGYYYVVVYHRNHLALMSSVPVQTNTFSNLYDFSAGPSGNYGGSKGLKRIDPAINRWGMYAGSSKDQNIYINDYTDFWVPDFGLTDCNSYGDFNMDGKVYIDDYTNIWVPNFGVSNVLP